MKKVLLSSLIVLFLFSATSCKYSASEASAADAPEMNSSKKPNIIFVMADDLGWGELNTYGNDFNETPNLKRLASQGIRFTHAYAAAPVCSPTRASIMTGLYPARVGITDFLAPKSKDYLKPEKYVTVNEALGREGYHTGMIGKWHLDTDFKENPGGPGENGFDEVIGTETKYIADGDYFFPYDKVETFRQGKKDEFLTDRLVEEAVGFIDRNKEKPFFLYLSHYNAHTTLDAPEDLVEKYKKKFNAKYGEGKAEEIFDDQKRGRHRSRKYEDNPYLAAMLEKIDAGVGRIMKKLDKEGIAENTILVFFSDNGGANNVGDNAHLRAHKGWLYEGGIREPLIMRWPEKIEAGTVTDVPISSVDFYPTFVDAAGGEYPEDYKLDGVSLVPLITNGIEPDPRPLFWHFPSENGGWHNSRGSAVRQGKFKLLYFYKNDSIELYNLEKDPREQHNLVKEMPEKAQELYNLLNNWKEEVGAEPPA